MRSEKYLIEDKKREEIKERITATLVAAALAITPAAVIYKIEENKINTMSNYYEVLLQETNKASYYQGFFDGLFGVENKYYEYITEKKEELIIPKEETTKKLVYTKKGI